MLKHFAFLANLKMQNSIGKCSNTFFMFILFMYEEGRPAILCGYVKGAVCRKINLF
jgi:hypothetical protein